MNTPWKYITLTQLLSSVKSDLNLYDDAGLIDEDRVIKIIAECNEKLGQRIYKPKECKIVVKDYKASIPEDLYKIQNIFATKTMASYNTNAFFGARQVEFTETKPEDETKIITYGKMGCVDSCNNCYWVADRREKSSVSEIVYQTIYPLSISNSVQNKCLPYSPCTNWKGEYQVDLDENDFNFSFKEGEVYVSYLGNLEDENGELQIPFHPKLNSYYEYSVKEKILEDLFLNSEADVVEKIRYINEKKREAYAIAWNYVQTRQVNEWTKVQENLQRDYYNKWYKIFN